MAETDFGALTNARKKVWSERTWIQGRDRSFWYANGMMGSGTEDDNKPIHLVTELTATERGDRCVMQLINELQGDGVAGDNPLDGNEESLVNDDQEIVIDQFRSAVKNRGRMAEQRTVIRFRAQARNKLSYWLTDKLDEMTFLMASGRAFTLKLDGSTRPGTSQLPQLAFASSVVAASAERVVFPNAVTAESNVTTADTMSWVYLVKCAAYARYKRLKPIRMNGKELYCVVMTPQQARDLKTDSNYMTNVGRAQVRGDGNPLFTGAFAMIDNLLLYEHPKIYNTLGTATKWGAGTNVNGAQALLLGAQAVGFARIGEASWEESTLTDYNNKKGIGYGRMVGLLKPQFRSIYDNNVSVDFSVLSLKTAAAA